MQVSKYELYCKTSAVWEYPKFAVENAKQVYDFVIDCLELVNCDREKFVTIATNTKGEIIGVNEASIGTLNSSPVHPREVLKFAVMNNACGIICLHNHPSGNTKPSNCDISTTKRLNEACEILGISLLDHIIVGFDTFEYTSLKAEGYIN